MTEAQRGPWTPPEGPLGRLTERSRGRAAAARAEYVALERRALDTTAAPSFVAALRRADIAIIAELKRRSPSKGVLDESLDAGARAAAYAAGGAAALSILTEPTEFGGALEDLTAARTQVQVPLLRKDFIVDEVQLLEARVAGASAVLLIARAHPPAAFARLATAARALGLDVLLEVRDERELECALAVGDGVIGINNRNLETLAIDDSVSERLLRLVPSDRLAVYESGVRDAAGVQRAAALGADAVLIGSALSVAVSAADAVRALTGVARGRRG
ncbi:MAG: indole-3-glycerol phosphate synthase TrpC [Gemmatimonadota bacterium]|nr:indole-3-glycerol phosphate synthase TrpC [Gemmatimonadota bacterium]